MQVLFTSDLFTYADIKASVAKDNYPNLSPGDAWLGPDIAAFVKYMRWHRPDLAPRFTLGGTVFQDELQPIMKGIDPDFPGPVPTPVTPVLVPTVLSVAIKGSIFAQVGVETYYTAEATMSDGGKQDVTGTAMWTSSNIHSVTVDRFGVVNGRVTGKSILRASAGGAMSPGYEVSAVSVLPPLNVVSIAVTGPTTVVDGETGQYTATATMSDSTTQDVTSTATWASSDTATATVSAAGLLTAVAEGNTSITAAQDGFTSPALAVTVTAATIDSIAVTGGNSIAKGLTSQLTATATMSDATTQDITSTATWVSGTPANVTVSAAGLATGAAVGTSSVTAAQGGVTSPGYTVTVTAATVVSVAVTGGTTVEVGATVQLTAIATLTDSSTSDVSATATWVSSVPADATVSASGLVTGVAAGSTNITAASGGQTSPVHAVTVTAAP